MKLSNSFTAITSEGGLLPADFLAGLLAPKTAIEGLAPVSYNLAEGERINEQVNRSWNRLKGRWTDFKKAISNKQPGESTTTETRDRWLHPIFQELGFGQKLPAARTLEIDGRTYPVSHGWSHVPIHLVGSHVDIDHRMPGAVGAAKASPHSLVQQVLNASDGHLWGIVSNGLTFRLLRDNIALTRMSYVEWDLAAIFDGDLYSEFFVLWLVAHQSRFDAERAEQCWLERWKKSAEDKGLRALEKLYPGVKKAIAALGAGLVSHRANGVLLEKLRTRQLTTQEFYKQVLRVIYRMLFLFVAEDRGLLHPSDESADALTARRRYLDFYSITRLRSLTLFRSGTPHPDLWHVFQLLTGKLGSDTGCPELALPPLGSFLWSAAHSTPDLLDSLISNRHFLEAIHALAFVQDGNVRRAVDYKNLGSEELGSVYQGLLEMHPRINADAGTFELDTAAGNERKTSGSYYTPDSLVQCLLDSALEPVIAERLAHCSGASMTADANEPPMTPRCSGASTTADDNRAPYQAHRRSQSAATALPNRLAREKALLSLKVCDMAVGSGHFLLRAAHRIARHLARVRSGEDEPSPRAYQTALRDVIGHCLYGVDINSMAVELCKVTLWLEALEPGKPLSFLDHHIRCGNSLIGTTPDLIAAGLPDDAFNAIEGDDKAACASLRKINKLQREGLRHLFVQEDNNIREQMLHAAAAIDEISDDCPEHIHRKEAAFKSAQQNFNFQKARDLANLWCAAFVIRKSYKGGTGGPPVSESPSPIPTPVSQASQPISLSLQRPEDTAPPNEDLFGYTPPAPAPAKAKSAALPSSFDIRHSAFGITTQHLRDFVEDAQLPADLLAEAKQLADQYQFFHWHLAFPEVFAYGGFDVILGNPPWEMVELSEKEYFAQRAPEIANASSARLRQESILELKSKDTSLWNDFSEAKRLIGGSRHFIQACGRFARSSVGRINLYPLFTEAAASQILPRGRSGIIVPSAISMDAYNAVLFGWLLEHSRLVSLFDFENAGELFPNVHRSYRFCLLTLVGEVESSQEIEFCYFAHSTEELRDTKKRLTLSLRDIHNFSPNTLAPPILQCAEDKAIASRCYAQFGVFFDRRDGKTSAWKPSIQRMLSLSDEGDFFRRREELPAEIPDEFKRLYSGKTIHAYNHRFATFSKSDWRPVTISELSDPTYVPVTEYYAKVTEIETRLVGKFPTRWLFGYRDIARATDERTSIAAIVPRTGCDTHCRNIYLGVTDSRLAACLMSNMNTLIFDYLARQKIIGTGMGAGVLEQLPVVPPTLYSSSHASFGGKQTLRDWLLPRVLELTYTAWDLEPFAQDCGWSGPPFRWDEDRRFLLRCELDAAFFHLYLGQETEWRQQPATLTQAFPTPRDAVSYIMDTFPIVKRKDLAKHGHYRTQQTILEIYDALADSIQSGHPYQTRLDPPPADPACCHPPQDS